MRILKSLFRPSRKPATIPPDKITVVNPAQIPASAISVVGSTGDPYLDAFLAGEPLYVQSSNVVACQHLGDRRQMIVEYGQKTGGGQFYRYDDVSSGEAAGFFNAPSKGSWIWSVLRIRGTKDGHRKPFTPVSGFEPAPGYQPPGGHATGAADTAAFEDYFR